MDPVAIKEGLEIGNQARIKNPVIFMTLSADFHQPGSSAIATETKQEILGIATPRFSPKRKAGLPS